jgi:hypothetical protein
MATKRQRILEALQERLEVITIENGYETDLGLHILLGELPTFGPDDPKQVIAILPREDQPSAALNKIPIRWPIDIAVLLSPDLSAPWRLVEAGLGDVKKAVELEERTLGGLLTGGQNNPGGLMRGSTETYPRTSGSEMVGALITYVMPYVEVFGSPEA